MNKITPHRLRDLDKSIPAGTECYLCHAVRRALFKYRKGHESASFLEKDEALPILAQQLGRGLRRFFVTDIATALSKHRPTSVRSTI